MTVVSWEDKTSMAPNAPSFLALRWLGGVLFGCAIAGCSVQRPVPVWELDDVVVDAAESAQLRARIAQRADDVTSFRGLFQVDVRRGDDRAAFRQAVVFIRPDRLRIEALPSQGALTLNLFVSNRGSVVSLEPAEKKAFEGPASTAIFRRFLKLPFREGEIMALVTGRVEVGRLDALSEVRCGPRECSVVSAEERYRYRVDRPTGEIRSVRIRDPLQGKARIEVRYSDYAAVGAVRIPRAIALVLPNDGIEIDMTGQMLAINQPIPDRLFEVAIPTDYTRR